MIAVVVVVIVLGSAGPAVASAGHALAEVVHTVLMVLLILGITGATAVTGYAAFRADQWRRGRRIYQRADQAARLAVTRAAAAHALPAAQPLAIEAPRPPADAAVFSELLGRLDEMQATLASLQNGEAAKR